MYIVAVKDGTVICKGLRYMYILLYGMHTLGNASNDEIDKHSYVLILRDIHLPGARSDETTQEPRPGTRRTKKDQKKNQKQLKLRENALHFPISSTPGKENSPQLKVAGKPVHLL